MKKIFLMLVICLSLTISKAQNTKFPFGAYIYHFHGIENGRTLPMYEEIPGGGLFTKWNNWMKINNHMAYFYKSYGYSNDIIDPIVNFNNFIKANSKYTNPILLSADLHYSGETFCFEKKYVAPGIAQLSQGQYLSFNTLLSSYNQNNPDGLYKNPSLPAGVTVTSSNPGIFIKNNNTSTITAKVIENIQVKDSYWDGAKYTNWHTLRPWDFNTKRFNETDGVDTAVFYISFEIETGLAKSSSVGILAPQNTLYITLKNQHIINGDNSLVLNRKSVAITNGTIEVPFYVYIKSGSTGIYHDAYEFGPKLEIEAEMNAGYSFTIRNIKIYDKLGKAIIEDNYLTTNPKNYYRPYDYAPILTNGLGVFDKPIIHLCDESTIGSFKTMKKIIDYIRTKIISKTPYFFVTSPEGIEGPTVRRMFTELGTANLYIGPDPYMMNLGEDFSYTKYRENLIQHFSYRYLKTVRDVASEFNPKPYLYSVPQAHEWDTQLRLPTESEMIAEGYLSLLNNYKGILYWTIYLDNNNTTIYKEYDNTNRWDFLANPSMVRPEALNAIGTVGNFLNKNILNTSITHGDFLLDADVTNYDIIGMDQNNNTVHSKALNLGNMAEVLLSELHIVDPSSGIITPISNPALIGIGTFRKNNKSYFLVSNLDKDLEFAKIKLFFRTNASKFLKVTDLTNGHIVNRVYPANGIVLMDVPAKNSIILEVENTNIGNSNFPKDLNFGVARIQGAQTKVILDKNFYSQSGLSEEVEFTIPRTDNKMFMTDFGYTTITKDGIFDLGAFYFDKVPSGSNYFGNMYYSIYTQNTSGNFQYRTNKVQTTINYTHSSFDIFPLVDDFNNDGLTDFGYAVKNITAQRFEVYIPGKATAFYTGIHYANDGYVFIGKWGANFSICLYANGNFYFDSNGDGILEAKGMYIGSPNIPFIGDWVNDTKYEYGLYCQDNLYGLGFRLNFTGTDGISYFEFPYGMPGDKPIIWKSYNSFPNPFEKINQNNISKYSLSAYPNPFNPTTTINYQLAEDGFVSLKIYNSLGEEVANLVNQQQSKGSYSSHFDASNLASGIYIYRLQVNDFISSKKLMLIK